MVESTQERKNWIQSDIILQTLGELTDECGYFPCSFVSTGLTVFVCVSTQSASTVSESMAAPLLVNGLYSIELQLKRLQVIDCAQLLSSNVPSYLWDWSGIITKKRFTSVVDKSI